jgi:hypothetical protein
MLPFGVTIPATVPQGSEIPEGLMDNTVYIYIYIYIYGARCKARNFNVVYIWTQFDSAESRLFLFVAQCFNIESMQKVFLCHSCV